MPPTRRTRLGNFGEAAAAAHLTRQGYTLLARQWRSGSTGVVRGDIDLVVRDGACLVFVEVRARRSSGSYGSAEESLTPAKRARMVQLALAYLQQHHPDSDIDWRIDLIALEIDRSGRVARLNHIIAAVEEDEG